MRQRTRGAKRQEIKVPALVLLTLLALVFAGEMRAAEANLKPAPARAAKDKGAMFKDKCLRTKGQVKSPACVYGERGSKTNVVLFGDSHALQYGPTLDRISKQRSWRLVALMKGRCAISQIKTTNPDCDKWRKNSINRVKRMKPKLVVVSASTGSSMRAVRNGKTLTRKQSQPHLRAGMVKILRGFLNTGAKVVVIRDQALAPFRPNDCLRDKKPKQPNRACGFKPQVDKSMLFDAQAANKMKRVRLVNPHPKFCPKLTWCRAVDGNVVIYRDRYHITATYARTLSGWLGSRLPKF